MDKIILSARFPGSGKDTVARYLEVKYGYKQLAFADKIYEIAESLFDMGQKDRSLLQNIGQKMREIDEWVWINHIDKIIRQNNYSKIVISDLRQANELD